MKEFERLTLIAYVTRKSPTGWLGRTALMKFCYLLQTVRGVPLGYRFTLYSYGPFDSSVLSDLGSAESLGLVRATYEPYPSGYGYRIESLLDQQEAGAVARKLDRRCLESIDWVLENFGAKSAAALELETTIVFIHREAGLKGLQLRDQELIRKVRDVKPHFSEEAITLAVEELRSKRIIAAVARRAASGA